MSGYEGLPAELQDLILGNLDGTSLARMSMVNRTSHSLIQWSAEHTSELRTAWVDCRFNIVFPRLMAAVLRLKSTNYNGHCHVNFGRTEPRTARLCTSCRVSRACLVVPDIKSHRPERTICVSCQQMAAWVEVAMDKCMSGEEVLSLLG